MKKILFVGHSHTVAIESAAADSKLFDFIDLRQEEFLPNILKSKPLEINSAIEKVFAEKMPSTEAVVSCAHGNEYSMLGLVNHPRPFDFCLSNKENQEIVPGLEIIPEQFVFFKIEWNGIQD